MGIIKGTNGQEIYWYSEETRMELVHEVSQHIISNFGKGPFNTFDSTNPILLSLLELYTKKLKKIIHNELSLGFYQYIQILHSESNAVVINKTLEQDFPGFSRQDHALYRRCLKLLLEEACELELEAGESVKDARIRCITNFEELILLSEKIITTSHLMSSQHLIEDAVEVFFNEDDLYITDYKHNYNEIIEKINNDIPSHLGKAIIDNSAINDFHTATLSCLGADIKDVLDEIQSIYTSMGNEPFPCASGFDLNSLIGNLAHNSNISEKEATVMISGLILNKETKSSLEETIYKPQIINRHLYRPILEWRIKGIGERMNIVDFDSARLSLHQLATNAIGWRKYPPEWKSKCFNKYVESKANSNDKVLEDALEEILSDNNIIYDRNITSLITKNNQGVNIDNAVCGEIDFLFLFNDTIYIADSKYLFAKYDFNNWRGDRNKFEDGRKPYNKTIERKIDFLTKNIDLVQSHFDHIEPSSNFELSKFDIKGLFLINTPTFYMYSAKYSILTIKDFEDLLKGQSPYPNLSIMSSDKSEIEIEYPYFIRSTVKKTMSNNM